MAIQVFGQGAVQSAYPSYLSLNIQNPNINFPERVGDVTLVWSDSYVDVPYRDPITNIYYQYLAATMDVTAGNENDHTVTLPDATKTSKGQTFIITNIGDSDFILNDSSGAELQVVDHGISYWVTLTDNSTAVGTWRVITLGAGTSEASAAALAGNGLIALIDKLNTNVVVVSVAVPPVIDTTYRAKLIVWTGGANTIELPAIADVPAGYYVSFTNQGSAQIILQPTITIPVTTIGGENSLVVQVRQSLTIISDGTNWQTLGFGQNQFAIDSTLTLDVADSVDVTLNNIQASSIIQKYTGALTNNITIFFPPATSNWFISNNTTGPHTLTVRLNGGLGDPYVIPQGSKGIFYSDGTSMFVSPTALSLIDGTPAAPALSFLENNSTGLYRTVGGSLAVTVEGHLVAGFINEDIINQGIVAVVSTNGTQFEFISNDAGALITFNGNSAMAISLAGTVTFPTSPAITLNSLMPAATPGSIVYYNGANWVNLPIGTPGQVLTVNGGGNAPIWA